ncbi:hypothetical protein C2S51_018304 [Perilla frutescens var. frutescens]|nr:hypothetical protein C2S51_018304 [Perilla frutescens var. frutescens]
MTAVDVLIRSRRDVRDSEIEQSLKQARGFVSNIETNKNRPLLNRMNQNDNSWDGLMKQHGAWLEQKKSALMIVAILIATMAFQVGVNPPSGVWQDNSVKISSDVFSRAGFSHHTPFDKRIALETKIVYVDSDGDHMDCHYSYRIVLYNRDKCGDT